MSWPDAVGGFLAIADAATDEALVFRRDTTAIPGSGGRCRLRFGCHSGYGAVPCAPRRARRVRSSSWLARRAAGIWHLISRTRIRCSSTRSPIFRRPTRSGLLCIQRALNTLPDTGAAMEFRGLPVVVRDAWVVGLSPGPVVVRARRACAISRQRRTRSCVSSYSRATSSVMSPALPGDEEVVESWDLLAVLTVEGHPWLAVAREGAGSLQLELVARDRTAWRSVWRSDGLVCGASR